MTETKSPSIPGPAEVWITGIGLATSLGEGLDANWDALNARRVNVDEKTFAPYIVHPWAPVNLDTQIPKKGDQRQMEAWQRIGTYAAGLALDSAGLKGNKEILGRMDMIVAAGGGERDLAVDSNILNLQARGNSAPGFLNERLMNDLRPTLFLAQLSNLLAGNIAIVHGVTGSSRTFMGEETAGVDAARIALARIAAGQSEIALIGGSQNGERKDLLVLYEFGGVNLKGKVAPVWERQNNAGFALGSSFDNTVVFDDTRLLNTEGLRYSDECARHKVLDVIGDLALAGLPLQGAFRSVRGGHKLNHAVLTALLADPSAWRVVEAEPARRSRGHAEAGAGMVGGMIAPAYGPDVS